MNGYQSGDPRRAYMLAAAIWSAVTGLGLTYAVPPASFEREDRRFGGRVESRARASPPVSTTHSFLLRPSRQPVFTP